MAKIITLNVNGLNSAIKGARVTRRLKEKEVNILPTGD